MDYAYASRIEEVLIDGKTKFDVTLKISAQSVLTNLEIENMPNVTVADLADCSFAVDPSLNVYTLKAGTWTKQE